MVNPAHERAPRIAGNGHQHGALHGGVCRDTAAPDPCSGVSLARRPRKEPLAECSPPPPRTVSPACALDESSGLASWAVIVAQRDHRIDPFRKFASVTAGGVRPATVRPRTADGAMTHGCAERPRQRELGQTEDVWIDPRAKRIRQ
jgi:hypothetical protein